MKPFLMLIWHVLELALTLAAIWALVSMAFLVG